MHEGLTNDWLAATRKSAWIILLLHLVLSIWFEKNSMLYFPKITSNEIFYNVLFNSFEGIQDPKQDIEKNV